MAEQAAAQGITYIVSVATAARKVRSKSSVAVGPISVGVLASLPSLAVEALSSASGKASTYWNTVNGSD
jgi:hypothetical protein